MPLKSIHGWGRRLVFGLLSALLALAAHAADDFLEPERAFRLSARVLDERHVELSFDIAPGYYMYREKFRFNAPGATIGPVDLPAGKVKFDETFQKDVETYRERLRVRLPVIQAPDRFQLVVTSQGCADKGLCYPPMESGVEVRLAAFGGDGSARLVTLAQTLPAGEAQPRAVSSGEGVALDAALQSGRFWSVVAVFFGAGMLLSLTPCVLPMLPILSSIIVGQGPRAGRGRGLLLAGSYSLGMALVYTLLGIGAGLAGEGLAAALQNAWVLGGFAVLLVLLSLSMFGVYELRLPVAWTTPLSRTTRRLPAGRLAGVFGMGGLSALIVSPCVAAPLAGALVYLSQTRDVALGGSALFSLAAGMSVPLLLLGASAGAWLPRAGAWMEGVRAFFGLLLLGVAVWMASPLLPAPLTLALWGALLVGAAILLKPFAARAGRGLATRRALAAVLAVLGVLQLVGAASGGTDPLQPLARLTGAAADKPLPFTRVHSLAELDAALGAAGRPVMLDFYADWCVSCKEMERFTFSDAEVQRRLSGALLLKADVTRNTAEDKALLRRFQLFGPPGTLFFDAQGREIPAARVVGFQRRDRFLQTLQEAGL